MFDMTQQNLYDSFQEEVRENSFCEWYSWKNLIYC